MVPTTAAVCVALMVHIPSPVTHSRYCSPLVSTLAGLGNLSGGVIQACIPPSDLSPFISLPLSRLACNNYPFITGHRRYIGLWHTPWTPDKVIPTLFYSVAAAHHGISQQSLMSGTSLVCWYMDTRSPECPDCSQSQVQRGPYYILGGSINLMGTCLLI